MTNDLLPDRLKYFWADDEEGPYQGPFDSRDLAVSDAYCYRAKCFDDPSQTDGLFMIKTKGLLVDAVESPEYVLSIDVTDEFHDTWKTRADRVSTPTKPAEVDLDALRREVWNGAGLLTEQAEMHLDRILNYLASTGRISGWMPIESAPRDGTTVFVIYKHSNHNIGWEGCEGYYNPTNGAWSIMSGYTEYPTHWMPLPQPPEVKE